MEFDPFPNQLKDFQRSEKVLVFKRILFKKIIIIMGMKNFQKLKELYVMCLSN